MSVRVNSGHSNSFKMFSPMLSIYSSGLTRQYIEPSSQTLKQDSNRARLLLTCNAMIIIMKGTSGANPQR